MSILETEYNEKAYGKTRYDEGVQAGIEQGLEKGRAVAQQAIFSAKQHTLLFKNVVILHTQHFSDETIAQKLHVSINTVQDILKELTSNIPEISS